MANDKLSMKIIPVLIVILLITGSAAIAAAVVYFFDCPNRTDF